MLSKQLAIVMALVLSLAAAEAMAEPSIWKRQGWADTDFSKSSIEWREIRSGGPPKDGIPAIDKPIFAAVTEVQDLQPQDPVVGLEVNGDARAYPLRVLIWHEIANDMIGGVPVSVTYCPLCNSAIAFDRRVKGKVLDFGTTGKLRNSDLVMYDRQTQSWWQQFTGEAIVGEMLGTTLKMLPARLESFAEFKARHPGGKVLIPNNPESRAYGNNPYAGYDRSRFPFLYNGPMPKGIEPMARVVVVKAGAGGGGGGGSGKMTEQPMAVAMSVLRKAGSYRLGDVDLTWRKGQASALDSRDISRGRDVGTVNAQKISAGGAKQDIPYDVTFAFVFHAFHPQLPIITK